MKNLGNLLKQEEYSKVWEKYCGFLNLSIDEFMSIQESLLMEQIELLSSCELGKRIMGEGIKPKSVEEFRKLVPLTTYDDYADILLNKRENALPAKPMYWMQTTWKGGTHPIKVAPYTESMIKEHTKCFIASLILATTDKPEVFSLREEDKFLYGMAPLPYLTGLAPYVLKDEISFKYLPDIELAETLSFEDRNIAGFDMGLRTGIDLFFGLSSVLVRIGESFAKGSKERTGELKLPINPRMLLKLIKAKLRSKITGQPILPKHIWDMKGIICAGTDTHTFKEKIEHYWGKKPLEIYGGTEITTVATEAWSGKGLTFFPDVNFLEFIPEKDSIRSLKDKNYVPPTLLFNEIKSGERYEIVTTKFRGGAFARYRVGDIIQCLSMSNEECGIKLPQVAFVDRVANVIDLAGFTRITNNTVSEALKSSKLAVYNWTAIKEYVEENPVLHIYIELKGKKLSDKLVKEKLNSALSALDSDFSDLQTLLGRDPLKVTMVEPGSFDKCASRFGKEINKINPIEEEIKSLIS
jgi:hypothetical protein